MNHMNQGEETSPIYREVQQFRQVWIWVVVFVLAGLVWYATVKQLLLHRPFGTCPLYSFSANLSPKYAMMESTFAFPRSIRLSAE